MKYCIDGWIRINWVGQFCDDIKYMIHALCSAEDVKYNDFDSVEGFVEILKTTLYQTENYDKHMRKLTSHKKKIFECVRFYAFTFPMVMNMSRRLFAQVIYEYIGNKKLNGPLLRLYDKMSSGGKKAVISWRKDRLLERYKSEGFHAPPLMIPHKYIDFW